MGISDVFKNKIMLYAGLGIIACIVIYFAVTETTILETIQKNAVPLVVAGLFLYAFYTWQEKSYILAKDPGEILRELCGKSVLLQYKGITWSRIRKSTIWVESNGSVGIIWFDIPGTNIPIWIEVSVGLLGSTLLSIDERILTHSEARKRIKPEVSVDEIKEKLEEQNIKTEYAKLGGE